MMKLNPAVLLREFSGIEKLRKDLIDEAFSNFQSTVKELKAAMTKIMYLEFSETEDCDLFLGRLRFIYDETTEELATIYFHIDVSSVSGIPYLHFSFTRAAEPPKKEIRIIKHAGQDFSTELKRAKSIVFKELLLIEKECLAKKLAISMPEKGTKTKPHKI